MDEELANSPTQLRFGGLRSTQPEHHKVKTLITRPDVPPRNETPLQSSDSDELTLQTSLEWIKLDGTYIWAFRLTQR